MINDDGSIEKGAQNLPGNWESSKFNLPASLIEAIPEIGDHDTAVLMHNDGVVQGLSEVPFMQDVERWGVLTIGTGLGNARFTNRRKEKDKDQKDKDDKKERRIKTSGPILAFASHFSGRLCECQNQGPLANNRFLVEFWIRRSLLSARGQVGSECQIHSTSPRGNLDRLG